MIRGERLHRLQNLDQEIEDCERRISEIKLSLGESDALREARHALAAAEEEHRSWAAQMRDLELEIQSLTSKIGTSEKRLYGGNVTNPKELSDIQDEIASLKRRRLDLEDELLEAMVYSEEAEEAVQARHKTHADTESEWQAEQQALVGELSELETRLEEAHQERDRLRLTISTGDLDLYDRTRAHYGSIAVTTLHDGVCGFCAVAPSSTKLARIRSGRELLQCSNCGRILLHL